MIKKRKKAVLTGLFLLFVGYIAAILLNQQMQLGYIKSQKQQISQQIEALKEENKLLEQQIKLANTDQYIEKAAREQLGMVKDGEVRYVDEAALGK